MQASLSNRIQVDSQKKYQKSYNMQSKKNKVFCFKF